VHEVGTVVFTVSAQFGVPVTNTWASTRGITSFARRIVNSPAEVEALGHEGVSESAMGHSATSVRRSRRSALCDWNRVEGNWKQVKGKVKEKWGKLTDDDLTAINGRRDQLDPRALLDLRPHCGCGNALRARPREEIIEAQ
jgi:uncharacterized protein YjbJ (UPF0337 family)